MTQPQNYLFDKGFEMRAEFVAKTSNQAIRTNISYDRQNGTVYYDIPDMMLDSEYDMNIVVFPPGADIQSEIIIENTELLEGEEAGDTAWYDPASDTQETKNTSASAVVSNKKAANVTVSNGAPKSILDYEFKTSKHVVRRQGHGDAHRNREKTRTQATRFDSQLAKELACAKITRIRALFIKYSAQIQGAGVRLRFTLERLRRRARDCESTRYVPNARRV